MRNERRGEAACFCTVLIADGAVPISSVWESLSFPVTTSHSKLVAQMPSELLR
jgi:hypothetical protein